LQTGPGDVALSTEDTPKIPERQERAGPPDPKHGTKWVTRPVGVVDAELLAAKVGHLALEPGS